MQKLKSNISIKINQHNLFSTGPQFAEEPAPMPASSFGDYRQYQ